MKEIKDYKSEKYGGNEYVEIESGIYRTVGRLEQNSGCYSWVQAKEEEAAIVRNLEGWTLNKEFEMYEISYKGKMYFKQDETIMVFANKEKEIYVTSLSFIQEPELGEGSDASDISQYPLEDVLDKFFCYISDDYAMMNCKASNVCVMEFASEDIEDIRNLRTIIGKHVYNKENGDFVELVIE